MNNILLQPADQLVLLSDLNPPSKLQRDLGDNLVDLFAGCGGSGGGLLDANEILGRSVKGTFVNHWDKALEIHESNHPEHRHIEENLFLLDPAVVFPSGTACSLLWASPACTFFSVARGAACVNDQDRSHAHSVTDWIRHLRPEAVIVENVAELLRWGPVTQKRRKAAKGRKGELMWARNNKPVKTLPRGHNRARGESEPEWSTRMLTLDYKPYEVPDKTREGEYFNLWIAEVLELDYDVEWRVLASCDYGDPTIRKRLFIYFVKKGCEKRIVWPYPYAQDPNKQATDPRPMLWRTARQCINWKLKGTSVFTRPKKLAPNTFRRLAIGLVKYGLNEFLVSAAHGSPSPTDCARRVHDVDSPVHALTSKGIGDRGVVEALGEYIIPNFSERPGQTPRTHDVDEPVPTVTGHGAGGIVEIEVEAYILPKDAGHKQDWVKGVDQPVSALTTNHSDEGLVEPNIVHMKGQSNAQSVDEPLTAITGKLSHYVSQPMIDNIRGTGVVHGDDEPLRAITSGGSHQALAEAFMFSIDQSGGVKKNDGTYPVDEPMRTLVTKVNQTCIELDLEEVSAKFLHECGVSGVDTTRAITFLEFLVAELKRRGRVDAKPWIYVYYSSGSEGKSIDEPMPAVRTKAGHALVYPVIELDGKLLKIDLLYRMLTPLELQRAMGFPDDMKWSDATKTERIKAIGNSVSRGVARALGLAWYSQDPDVWSKVKHLYENAIDDQN